MTVCRTNPSIPGPILRKRSRINNNNSKRKWRLKTSKTSSPVKPRHNRRKWRTFYSNRRRRRATSSLRQIWIKWIDKANFTSNTEISSETLKKTLITHFSRPKTHTNKITPTTTTLTKIKFLTTSTTFKLENNDNLMDKYGESDFTTIYLALRLTEQRGYQVLLCHIKLSCWHPLYLIIYFVNLLINPDQSTGLLISQISY